MKCPICGDDMVNESDMGNFEFYRCHEKNDNMIHDVEIMIMKVV